MQTFKVEFEDMKTGIKWVDIILAESEDAASDIATDICAEMEEGDDISIMFEIRN